MDGFEKFLKAYHKKHMSEWISYTSDELHMVSSFWQESARQKQKKIVGLINERLADLAGLNSSTVEIKRLELLKLVGRIEKEQNG